MVVLRELGGRDKYSLVEVLKQEKVNKPVVAWVSGTCARLFKSEVQFVHAVSDCPSILHLSILNSSCHCSTRGTFFNLPCDIVHQGAKSGGEMESAQAKNQAIKDAGAVVPTSYEAFETAIKETFEKLVSLCVLE
jgi:ATP citrate (pro-S)-lyase